MCISSCWDKMTSLQLCTLTCNKACISDANGYIYKLRKGFGFQKQLIPDLHGKSKPFFLFFTPRMKTYLSDSVWRVLAWDSQVDFQFLSLKPKKKIFLPFFSFLKLWSPLLTCVFSLLLSTRGLPCIDNVILLWKDSIFFWSRLVSRSASPHHDFS